MREAQPGDESGFRDHYRGTSIGLAYRGRLHAAFTVLGSLAVIVLAGAALHAVRAVELLTIPATFLFASLAEYQGHRHVMHRPRGGFHLLYRRHTLEHHRFFTHERMAFDTTRDWKILLFPPILLLFFIGGIAAPVGAILFMIATPNIAWLYVATALAYFLTYELLHFLYHCPEAAWVWRIPGLKTLGRHHRAHHDPRHMGRYNFNITFPIFDLAFGTLRPTVRAVTDEAQQR